MINILAWLLAGILTGLLSNRVARPLPSGGAVLHAVAGVMGALAGGVVFLIFDSTPLYAFNPWGMVVALLGAVVMIALAQIVIGQAI
jgi:uncharacterized membrane protein YeaQ/YmgE (transglycosylase-associated protein family)